MIDTIAAVDLMEDVEAASRVSTLPKVLEVVCRTTGMGFAVLAKVTGDRWIACGVQDNINLGIGPGSELDVETTVCHTVRRSGAPVIVESTDDSVDFRDHPARLIHGFRSFISVPVVLPDGRFFGTLTALDKEPRRLDSGEMLRSFELFSDLVALNVEKELQLRSSTSALAQEREVAELREQFIAVLGHDLRNPLASIKAANYVLRRDPTAAPEVASLIEQGTARMSGLIDDVLDFARGRLGGGIPVSFGAPAPLTGLVGRIVDEFRSSHPQRTIIDDVSLDVAISCDRGRMEQLVCNLVGNAIKHGAPDAPIWISGRILDDTLVLSIENLGTAIPPEMLTRLFQPFVRGMNSEGGEGLGLGLFIAMEIARTHGGRIVAESSGDLTRFTFRMPIIPAVHDRTLAPGAMQALLVSGSDAW